jgi:uncharacterized damage-inducible protein DinB
MIDADWCLTMARYNEWMNSRLYALCATLPDAELRRDRGAFFKSIYGTLNHIVYGDLAFLSRFTGEPANVPEVDRELFAGFAELREARAALDARLLRWAASLADDWLRQALSYTSKIDGRTRTVARWVLVTHLFNHETHHRGQLTTLLSQMGLDVGSTELPFMSAVQQEAAQADAAKA